MIKDLRLTVWDQFGAAIDSLENAMNECPDKVWGDRIDWHEFWYLASHTLWWLDYYLTDSPETFRPPEPFDMCETDPEGALPERIYTKAELLHYLAYCRDKCRNAIAGLTDDAAGKPSVSRRSLTVLALILYNMRHVQHHTAQLNLMLRQQVDSAPRWLSHARTGLED